MNIFDTWIKIRKELPPKAILFLFDGNNDVTFGDDAKAVNQIARLNHIIRDDSQGLQIIGRVSQKLISLAIKSGYRVALCDAVSLKNLLQEYEQLSLAI